MSRILVIDNLDSFVYTLNGYLNELGAETVVIRNNAITLVELEEMLPAFDAILISPGPGAPADAGISPDAIRLAYQRSIPLFGVCLGHQGIAEVFGATVTHAPTLMHGKTSQVTHDGSTLFEGVPNPFTATRYHSLAVVDETVPDDIIVTARTNDGTIMALQHATAPIYGVQYHPESVLTEAGYRMIGNWLESVGQTGAAALGATKNPLIALD